MVKRRMTVLMACTHHWDSPMQVGSQNLGRQFLKNGFRIGYLSAPLTAMHLAKFSNRELWHRFKKCISRHREPAGELAEIIPFALIAPAARPILNSSAVNAGWYKTAMPRIIRRLEARQLISPDILYIDNLAYWFLADLLNPDKIVFRVMDNYMGVPGTGSATRKAFARLCSRADLVVYTARELKKLIEPYNPRSSLFVPNGVELDRFAGDDAAVPDEYRDINNPIAVYVGDMDVRFDLELLLSVAEKLKHVSFVLVGPGRRVAPAVASLENVYCIGTRPYTRIPAYLRHAHVGIIPFNVRKYPELINTICPLKLFQYMASGLKVVSTRWKELELMHSPATLCRTNQDFADAVDRAATEKYNPEPYLEYACQAGWDKRADAILESLGYRTNLTAPS